MYKNVLTIIIIRYKIFYKDRLRILFYMSSRFHQIVSNQNSPLPPPPPNLGKKLKETLTEDAADAAYPDCVSLS